MESLAGSLHTRESVQWNWRREGFSAQNRGGCWSVWPLRGVNEQPSPERAPRERVGPRGRTPFSEGQRGKNHSEKRRKRTALV